jgi:hypothetical protein
MSQQARTANSGESMDSPWRTLYRIAGAAALITAVFIPIQIVVFLVWPPPSTVAGHFALFQSNKLLGLLGLDLLLTADNVLGIPMFLAFYVSLRRSRPSLMAIATALGFIGIATYFASNTAVNMMSLSDQYAAATTDAERSLLLAAGQAMMAIYTGTAFHLSYILGSAALIIVAAVMLGSSVYSNATGYVGLVANVLALGLYVPTIGIFISIFSVLLLEVWYILLVRRLFRLG